MASRMQPSTIFVGGIAITIAMTLGGCTPAPPPPAVKIDRLSSSERAASTATGLDAAWNEIASQFPNLERPMTNLIRYVNLQEWPRAKADCLTAAGFPSEVDDDGGVSSHVAGAQASALALADFQCQAEYPLDPTFETPLNRSQLKFLYFYFTKTLTLCLEDAGFSVSPAPSFASFEDGYDSASSWTPYSTVPKQSEEGKTTWAEVNKQCPQVPTGLYGG